MLSFVSFVLVGLFLERVEGAVRCNGRTYEWASRWKYICCRTRILYKLNRYTACCGRKTYNPKSQGCCGGEIFRKTDVNSGCCYGKPFQRGIQLCCGRKVIPIKTQGCCRNVPFDKAYEACCEGVKTPNMDYGVNKNPTCCGTEIFNPDVMVCCAGQLAPNVAGIFTKCCKVQSYDYRKESCCHKVLPLRSREGQECCRGEMMDARKYICCGYGPMKRIPGEDNDCCRVGQYSHKLYNKRTHICCGDRLRRKLGKGTSCCLRNVYNVNTGICCNEKVFPRTPNINERCCQNGPYDRNKTVCCDKQLFTIPYRARKYTFCCGAAVYDRRTHECRYITRWGYELFSLNHPGTDFRW